VSGLIALLAGLAVLSLKVEGDAHIARPHAQAVEPLLGPKAASPRHSEGIGLGKGLGWA
jgi:hypothetical protein